MNTKKVFLFSAAFFLGLALYEPIKFMIPVGIKKPVKELLVGPLDPIDAALDTEAEPVQSKFWRRGSEQDAFWANEIQKGGYILHFRHAHRDMDNRVFGDTVVFDALDITEGYRGEESAWSENICLNAAGIRQTSGARLAFETINFPVSTVISSPNCRAEQTARLAFGKVDRFSQSLQLRLMFDAKGRDRLDGMFMELLNEVNAQTSNGNVVLVGHNGTIGYLGDTVPRIENVKVENGRSEMGFTVMSLSDSGELVFHHEFAMLRHFLLATLPLPITDE